MPQLPDLLANDARDKWAAISGAAHQRGITLRIPAELAEESRTVLACSDFVARTAQRAPAVFDDLLHSGDLQRAYPPGTFRAIVQTCLPPAADDFQNVEEMLGVALRKVRQREMLRIAWRDLAGRADLDETMAELSDLADASIEGALSVLYDGLCRQRGTPTGPGETRSNSSSSEWANWAPVN